MKFSERMGITAQKAFQLKSMDDDLKSSLWNIVYKYFFEDIRNENWATDSPNFETFKTLWSDHFKMHTDNIPEFGTKCIEAIKYRYFKCTWDKVYDLLEFIFELRIPDLNNFLDDCNAVLTKEKSGYRIVAGQVTPITNEREMAEIEKAITESNKLNQKAVKEHLKNALTKLADRQEPDYRNSIKESISAIESLVRAITGNPKTTLGDALKSIDQKIRIHPALKDAYIKIYGYTSDSGGIRHGMTEDSECDLEDAHYMLISCSAFINYLIVKADKAGINF